MLTGTPLKVANLADRTLDRRLHLNLTMRAHDPLRQPFSMMTIPSLALIAPIVISVPACSKDVPATACMVDQDCSNTDFCAGGELTTSGPLCFGIEPGTCARETALAGTNCQSQADCQTPALICTHNLCDFYTVEIRRIRKRFSARLGIPGASPWLTDRPILWSSSALKVAGSVLV
jgi:hypothetical protein